jgi:hypothetical protein
VAQELARPQGRSRVNPQSYDYMHSNTQRLLMIPILYRELDKCLTNLGKHFRTLQEV